MARRDQYTNQVAVKQVQDPGAAVSCVCVVGISALLLHLPEHRLLTARCFDGPDLLHSSCPGIKTLLLKPVQYVSRGPLHCDVIRTLPVGG